MQIVTITDEDIQLYGGWYKEANTEFTVRYGDNVDLFIDIFAALSPRQHIVRNYRQARVVFYEYMMGVLDTSKLMYTHRPNVLRSINRQPLSGNKVQRFAENLKGNLIPVTVDTWIAKGYGIDNGKLATKVYREIESDIQEQAQIHHCYPAEYQATLWQKIRQANGKQIISLTNIIRRTE